MSLKLCPTCGNLHQATTKRCTNIPPRPYNQREYRRNRDTTIRNTPYCTRCGTTSDLTADHVTPIAKGGTGNDLVTLCRSCNSSKRDRQLDR